MSGWLAGRAALGLAIARAFAVAVFLASDEVSYIAGEIGTADGGWSAYGSI